MLTHFPEVPFHIDRRAKPLGNAPQSTTTNVRVQHDLVQLEGQAPPLWTALCVTFEGMPWYHTRYAEDTELRRIFVFGHMPPPALGTTPSASFDRPVAPPRPSGPYPSCTGLPNPLASTLGNTVRKSAATGSTSDGHHFTSIPGRNSSFLNGTQNSRGDAEASSSSMMGASSSIAISTILEHIQEVGTSTTVRDLVRRVAMMRQEFNAAEAHCIRMAVIHTFNMTPAGRHEIRVSPNDVQAAAAGYFNPMWSEATFRALHIAGLFIEFVKLGVNSPGDITIAAEQLLERRNCVGYLSLMHSLLQAGRDFRFPYDSIIKLRAKKEVLQSENGPWAKDISMAINNLRYPRRRRGNVVRKV